MECSMSERRMAQVLLYVRSVRSKKVCLLFRTQEFLTVTSSAEVCALTNRCLILVSVHVAIAYGSVTRPGLQAAGAK